MMHFFNFFYIFWIVFYLVVTIHEEVNYIQNVSAFYENGIFFSFKIKYKTNQVNVLYPFLF